eukprot:TRINITY_DN6229_c0_g1_i5.p3 TRINITY_DN6229_c0_g1~~TRINITY_DN6229_c0_g1_i5.p3  ORF type:complete len:101 (-),score=38.09 TRINITY_DN6229_c0_g1_i5:178-480(-)
MWESCLFALFFFFFQAEDGIRDVERSRGLGDVYKRQYQRRVHGKNSSFTEIDFSNTDIGDKEIEYICAALTSNFTILEVNLSQIKIGEKGAEFILSLIHI